MIFKNIRKKIRIALLGVGVAVCLSACGNGANHTYKIYYTNSSGTRLTSRTYKSSEEDKAHLIKNLLNQMGVNKNSDQYMVIKPNELEVTNVEIDGDKALISFNDAYNSMSNLTEVLYRTAVVKTITQVQGIEKVDFLINNSVIVRPSGLKLSNMSNSQYIDDNIGTGADTDWTQVSLYFTNEKGDKLIKTQTNVAYNSDVSLEKIVVAKLIAGPNENGFFRTIPSNTTLLGVSVRNRICYVNLSDAFLTNLVNAAGDLPIYSIVNSLCELKNIDGVKIIINGNSDNVYYKENTSLDTIFYFNDSYVEKPTIE